MFLTLRIVALGWGHVAVMMAVLWAFHHDRVCEIGLWRFSRHPNYFFEWLVWVSYAVFATVVPFGCIGWISRALILFFQFRVTGIPEAEAQAVRSRGDAYWHDQHTTTAFIPWCPRERIR